MKWLVIADERDVVNIIKVESNTETYEYLNRYEKKTFAPMAWLFNTNRQVLEFLPRLFEVMNASDFYQNDLGIKLDKKHCISNASIQHTI